MEAQWTTGYRDADLTFWMLVYHDHDLAERCLIGLRRHYPDSRVVMRSDGDHDPKHFELADRFGVDYRPEQRLFPVENGAAIVQRMFDHYLEQPTRYLFKIDPDTVIHRRFRYLPATDSHFGMLQGAPVGRSVQGGCMGFTADAAEEFSRSGLLLNAELRDPQPRGVTTKGQETNWSMIVMRAQKVGLTTFDWSLGWAAEELKVPLIEFPEVYSASNKARIRFVDNSDLRYAITHPLSGLIARDADNAGPGLARAG